MISDQTIEAAAEAAHNVNRAYCRSIGDRTQLAWVDAPDWQRQSAIEGVKRILEDPAMGPEAQHEAWVEHKRAEGWGWGKVKDHVAKTHPCLVPYASLPPWERAKDTLFGMVARAVLGYRGVKLDGS